MVVTLAAIGMAMIARAQAADAPPASAESRAQIEQRLQAAQERLEKSAQEVAALSLSLNESPGAVRLTRNGASRVMLGVNIDMQELAGANNEGVRVLSVSPGGPAASAGLRANDVIVAFNGKPLTGTANKSAPQQLLSLLSEAKTGEAVAVDYRRDGKVLKARVVPKSIPDAIANLAPPKLPAPPAPPNINAPFVQVFGFAGGLSGFGSAELVELSPNLGKYFGTEKGLLVVRAPTDQRLKLQDGDVILDVDGRAPTGVAHAFQILSSYRAGETLKLHIMRQQKRIELPVEVPEATSPTTGRLIEPMLENQVQS